ncbi:MAG: hypothetical protein V4714_22460 [Bacteroidota bacterium]
MQRLTPLGKLAIVIAIVGSLFGGFKYLQSQGIIGKDSASAQPHTEASSAQPNTPEAESNAPSAQATTPDDSRPAFNYSPPPPVDGKLKGVVELGASGFNSFIIKVDAQKKWLLQKAEFGNSLVIENMASDDDIRAGLKKYIGGMLDYGVSGKDIHFVVSSGAAKAEVTTKITKALKQLNYVVNQVTPEQEGTLGLKTVLPVDYESSAFVIDIGSGNTKISWKEGGQLKALETYGAKYFQNNVDDQKVYDEVSAKIKQIPENLRKTCFIIGGVPFELAKKDRKDKERYTVLQAPNAYQVDNAKSKAGLNIYKAVADASGCQQFVFDWDANFTIGFLLNLPQ